MVAFSHLQYINNALQFRCFLPGEDSEDILLFDILSGSLFSLLWLLSCLVFITTPELAKFASSPKVVPN